ncbi:hypothetical protein FRC05_005195 [Tulasnella sp. 425]|nr:hypothetical protein FRC05_005195 [Tulasnella sp. 425]
MIKPVIGRPPAIVEIAVQLLKAEPGAFMGPWFFGLVGVTYMMGVITNQVTKYFSTFGYESTRLFLLVVSCILLTIGQWLVILLAEWDWSVANYGDWSRFAVIPWEASALTVITWLTVFTTQLFFALRCYTLYGRSKLVLGALLFGMTACLGIFTFFGAMIAIDPFNFPALHKIAINGLCVNVATDLAITGLTLWKIGQGGNMYHPKTQNGLRRLRNLTVEAAVPPTICVILHIGFYVGMVSCQIFNHITCEEVAEDSPYRLGDRASSAQGTKNLISNWFAIVSPTIYVCSMMFTLNSRPTIRQTFNASTQDEDKAVSTGFRFAEFQASDRRREQGDIENTTVILVATPEPAHPGVRSSMNISQNRVVRLVNPRSSKGDTSDEVV